MHLIDERKKIPEKGKYNALFMHKFLISSALIAATFTALHSQSISIQPDKLRRVPLAEVGEGRYWQQLVITLGYDDAAADSAVTIAFPVGVDVDDTDGDGFVADEVRLAYVAAEQESPQFFVSGLSRADTLVISSSQPAAADGRLFVQFPIATTITNPSGATFHYGPITFADEREQDIITGPAFEFVTRSDFSTFASMNLVSFAGMLAAGSDTTTAADGTHFPEIASVLLRTLPELAVHQGATTSSNLLGFGDGTVYRFFFSKNASLASVDSTTATLAVDADGLQYLERSGEADAVRLFTRDLAAGTYYLYVTSSLTGNLPLGRSRGIAIQHRPQIARVEMAAGRSITLDSGRLFDLDGLPTGQSRQEATILFEAIDHDDSTAVHLFYSSAADLDVDEIRTDSTGVLLSGAIALTDPEGLESPLSEFSWDIVVPDLIPEGNYFIYAVVLAGGEAALGRSDGQIHVRHAPFLRFDSLNDRVTSSADSIFTGGDRPQRFVTLTWGRRGRDGDFDLDDNARINLFLSSKPAISLATFGKETLSASDSIPVPGGATVLLADLGSTTHPIAGGVLEDDDSRSDNQVVWDLWASSSYVPKEGVLHYVYGVISDGKQNRVVQMNGGRLNDAGSRLVFRHDPSIRPQQPLQDLRLDAATSARVSWEDQDLDDDARIRVILSAQDYGEIVTYRTATSGTAYIVNSQAGRAEREFNDEFDIREDSAIDFLDVRTGHLMVSVNDDQSWQPGAYFVYIAIEDEDRFNGETLTYRTPGQLIFEAPSSQAIGPFELLPESFTMGTEGSTQTVEVRVDAGGEVADLVAATFRADARRFAVADADPSIEGIQPFSVAEGFDAPNLITNTLIVTDNEKLLLSFAYFDPVTPGIEGLDGDHALAHFELVSLDVNGSTTIEVVSTSLDAGMFSVLERNGAIVVRPETKPLAMANLIPGRAVVRGQLTLEGRTDMTSLVDFSVRPWGSYRDLIDSVFILANDHDLGRDGVQVQVQADGLFELQEVPAGRFDLHTHLDGYIDGWSPALDPFPSEEITGVRPSSSGVAEDTLMWGGDVAGYLELDGSSRPDNEVTLADWDFVAALFDELVSAESDSGRADISGDGRVTVRDLTLVGRRFLHRGPRPVFKTPSSTSADRYVWDAHLERDGDEAELALRIIPAYGFSAMQVDLLFDRTQWQIKETVISPNAMHAQKQRGWGTRIAVVSMGRNDLLSTKAAVTWTLKALVPDPNVPSIAHPVLLDAKHRLLNSHVVGGEVILGSSMPQGFALSQNYPNPFNPETNLAFTVVETAVSGEWTSIQSAVTVDIFNTLGQKVRVLIDDQAFPMGSYQVVWDGRDDYGRVVGSGVYLYRLRDRTGSVELFRRMLLLR